MKKFAMLGKWHVHAEEYARQINALPGCCIAKVWDENEATAKAWAETLHCESAGLDEILTDPEIEGVLICTATSEHAPLMLKVAASGKAMFTEKVLTIRSEDAFAVRKAVLDHYIRFTISFTHLSEPTVQYALAAAKAGRLGDIHYARLRNVHNGALSNWLPPHFYDAAVCGGGAMIDLGAHPMYLLTDLLGLPQNVRSSFTHVTGKAVEDNAVSVLEYENGALAVSETGFVSTDYPYTFEIGGTKGTLIIRGKDLSICCEDTNHAWVQVQELPAALPAPLAQWALADCPEDIPANIGIDAAVRLTQVMEMAYQQ